MALATVKTSDVRRAYLRPESALLAAAFVGLLAAAASTDIQDIDEATYAEVGREALESGDWIHTEKNYKPFYQHPPLVPWLMAASMSVFGVSAFAARLPNVLVGVLCLLLTAHLGRRLGGRAGPWAALLLATAPGFYLMVKDSKLDMVFTTSILAACVAYLEVRDGRVRRWPWIYVAMAAAALTKGPVGALIPATLIGLDLLLRRDRNTLRALRPLAGIAILLAVAVPWYVAMAERHGWPFFERLVLHMFVARFFQKQLTSGNEPWFYFVSISWMFFPWLIPLGAELGRRGTAAWRKLRDDKQWPGGEQTFFVLYAVVPFVAMSLSRSKLDHYIAPMLPPAAALAAHWLDRNLSPTPPRWLRPTMLGCLGVGLVAVAGVQRWAFPPASVWPLVLPLVATPLALLWARPSLERTFYALAASLLFVELMLSLWFAPALMAFQPSRRFAEALSASPAPEAEILAYEATTRPSLNFYARRKARKAKLPEIKDALGERGAVHVLTRDDKLDELRPLGCLHLVDNAPMFHTSRPNPKFLLEASRDRAVKQQSLVLLRRCDAPAP